MNCMIAIVPLFDFLFNYTPQVKLWYQRLKKCYVPGSTTEIANIAHETNTNPPTEEMTVAYQPEVAPEAVELQPVSFFTAVPHVNMCESSCLLQDVGASTIIYQPPIIYQPIRSTSSPTPLKKLRPCNVVK